MVIDVKPEYRKFMWNLTSQGGLSNIFRYVYAGSGLWWVNIKYDLWPLGLGKNFRGNNGGFEVEAGRGFFGSDFVGPAFGQVFVREGTSHKTDFLAQTVVCKGVKVLVPKFGADFEVGYCERENLLGMRYLLSPEIKSGFVGAGVNSKDTAADVNLGADRVKREGWYFQARKGLKLRGLGTFAFVLNQDLNPKSTDGCVLATSHKLTKKIALDEAAKKTGPFLTLDSRTKFESVFSPTAVFGE